MTPLPRLPWDWRYPPGSCHPSPREVVGGGVSCQMGPVRANLSSAFLVNSHRKVVRGGWGSQGVSSQGGGRDWGSPQRITGVDSTTIHFIYSETFICSKAVQLREFHRFPRKFPPKEGFPPIIDHTSLPTTPESQTMTPINAPHCVIVLSHCPFANP